MTTAAWSSPQFIHASGDRPLDGYTIKRGIGRGGFGEVYYAISDGGKEVALKLVQRHLDVELRGVTQCLNLKHPNLVTIYDVRQAANSDCWIVMEHVSGTTLSDTIGASPAGLPPDQVLAWVRGICAGVGHLHEHGIVHRDLKPGNIFLEEGTVKIGDYGLAKYISASRRSGQTESVGTVYYMAPEISRGRYGKEIDLYALGVILFEMLTGRLPFNGESPGEILMRHLTEQPDVSMLADPFRRVVARLLYKEPAGRYASVQDLLTELGVESHSPAPRIEAPELAQRPPLVHATASSPAVPQRPEDVLEPPRRPAWRSALAGALALAAVLIVIALFRSTLVPQFDGHPATLVSEQGAGELANSLGNDQATPVASAESALDAVTRTAASVPILAVILGVAGLLFVVSRRPRRDLYRAAKSGDISRVRSLLQAGADVHARRCGKRTALMAAAEAGHCAVVKHLIEQGADPNARLSNGKTALSLAAEAGHGAVVQALLAAGADVNSRARDGDTPLIEAAYAGHLDILRTLLDHGADLTARSGHDGSTPLIWAAYAGHSACVKALLDHGANANEKDMGDGSTPIIWAAYGNHPNVVRILLEHGADPTETNSSGETALDHAESTTMVGLLESATARR